MKKLSIVFLSLMLMSAVTFAQKSSPEEKAQIETDLMKKELSLSPIQEEAVMEINLEAAKSTQLLRSGGNKDTVREGMKEVREKKLKQLQEILSDEQYEKYQTLMQDRKSSGGKNKGKRR